MNESSVKYKVEYHTENHYEDPVWNAHWQLLILPQNNNFQTRIGYKTSSNIAVDEFITSHLFSGDSLSIHFNSRFQHFTYTMNSTVEVAVSNPFDFQMKTSEEERKELQDHCFCVDNSHFLYNHELTELSQNLTSQFTAWEKQNLLEYCQLLLNELNSAMTFSEGETEVDTTAEQALKIGKGVCQDFAHVFIGLLRNQKIPARYVAGYLCQGKDFNGASQLHAWVECYIPGAGWVGMDPSNHLLTDEHYIKICHGRSYEDCNPIRGVLETAGSNSTSHQVKISQIQQQ